jgi:hypothetical protein
LLTHNFNSLKLRCLLTHKEVMRIEMGLVFPFFYCAKEFGLKYYVQYLGR